MTPVVDPILDPNSILELSDTITFEPLPEFDIIYRMQCKVFRQEGDLKYEYNPFRNIFSSGTTEIINGSPVITDVGKLKDFRTSELGFNLNNPVEMTIQPSYDGTVNVILNDDKNPPRLVNSRFTPKEDMRYEIVDRRGNNDTNVYKEEFVEQTTRLFKTTEKIPYVVYKGLQEGGALEVGNYIFYFKYVDADGNESDIIAESGIISCHIGKLNDPFSIRSGLYDENSNKIIKLSLNNIDTAYDYINVYFSRTTGGYEKEPLVKYYKISSKKSITNQKELEIIVTGLDRIEEISIDQLNIQYNIVDKVKTHAQVQNMLFLGNVDKPTVPYKELEDLSLRFYPTISNENNIGRLTHEYEPIEIENELDNYEYYNTHNIYRFTGYWDKEIYRVGVVYILKDDSLSPVFNVRGKNGLNNIVHESTTGFQNKISSQYTYEAIYNLDGSRNYIEVDEEGFLIDSSIDLENAKGTFRIDYHGDIIQDQGVFPIGVDFNVENDVVAEIKKYAKGFFFVRQKRIPTTLLQGITIGVDEVGNVPTLRAQTVSNTGELVTNFFTESFIDNTNELTHDFTSRLIYSNNAYTAGLLSPEAILKSVEYNNLFTGTNYKLSQCIFVPEETYFTQDVINNRHFYVSSYKNDPPLKNSITDDVKLTLIEDNQPLRYSGTKRFSTRAGIPEEAWRISFFGYEDRSAAAKSIIRGSYTGFVGMEGYNQPTTIVNVHIPGYSMNNMRDYFLVRFNSSDAFYTISDRYDLIVLRDSPNSYNTLTPNIDNYYNDYYRFNIYRGDCYINTVTVRMQRNFQDPDVPISDTIVDAFTWKDNYKGFSQSGAVNSEELLKINRNDVNAVEIGHWVTFKVCSNINLALRTTDDSESSEYALTGTNRSFYPLGSLSTKGESKIPESTMYNVGNTTTVGNKLYYSIPDVPYIKNIFDTRIMFSDTHITDAFRNGYRIFQGLSYKDVTRQYGGIVKIFDMRENLLVVFERGVAMFAINREALFAAGETGDVFTKGVGVLSEKPQHVISDMYGSMWQDSIYRTKHWIYGVDTVAKKIWRTNGKDFELLSDFRMQLFLNRNIILSETDKHPMIGLKNVKTHFNAYKNDVIFTFYDSTNDDGIEIKWSLCYNELQQKFITFYSWTPMASENVSNVWFTFDRESGKNLALPGYTNNNNEEALGITLVGKVETFNKTSGGNTVTRTENNSINIVQLGAHKVGDLKMKGYNYYDQYILKYNLTTDNTRPDNNYFEIRNNTELWWSGQASFPKYSYELQAQVGLYSLQGGNEVLVSSWKDLLGVKVARNYVWANGTVQELEDYDIEFSTWFWKHGQAGIFDISTPIYPTMWYDKQEPFEYEFIVVDSPDIHKIIDNLNIISNNAEPDSFQFTVTKDVYHDLNRMEPITINYDASQITEVEDDFVSTYQKGLDVKDNGIRLGNMTYKENFWKVEIKPNRFTYLDNNTKVRESRVRDKYCRIRVRYTGEKLALITALYTLYTQSFA